MTYCACRVDEATVLYLEELQENMCIANPLPRKDLHCTIYTDSEKWRPKFETLGKIEPPWVIDADEYEIKSWKNDKGTFVIVLCFPSPQIINRYADLLLKYPSKQARSTITPHFTLSYDSPIEIKTMVAAKPITIIEEFFEKYDDDWETKEGRDGKKKDGKKTEGKDVKTDTTVGKKPATPAGKKKK